MDDISDMIRRHKEALAEWDREFENPFGFDVKPVASSDALKERHQILLQQMRQHQQQLQSQQQNPYRGSLSSFGGLGSILGGFGV